MGYPVDRIQLYNQNGVPLPELYPNEVESRVRHEEINGEHTLTLVTKRKLDVGWRALTVDGTGKWREWVVEQADELHEAGINAVGTYRLVWSLQYDLTYTYDDTGRNLGHREIGIASSATGAEAIAAAISGSKKWTVSEHCDVPAIAAGGGVVMIAENAWDRLSKVVDAWGGEVDAEISVGATGVRERKVAFMVHLGKTTPTRRFEWGEDLTSISRVPDPGPYFCRVVPIGKGTTEYAEGPAGTDPTDDSIQFEWPLSLLDDPTYDPHPNEWIEDEGVAEAFRISDGNGGWEYPTKVVKYDQDDVQLLYEAAMEDLHNHTRPNITYEASVAQFARAGFDAKGVALGDEIQVVDRGFNPDAELRIQERVTSIDIDELDDDRTELTIGQAQESLADTLASMNTSFDDAVERISYYTTPAYVRDLIGWMNNEINRSGGYTYIVPGRGQVTYDVAVSDPNVGDGATKAVEIRGGSIRIGSRADPDSSWEWNTVFVNGHIAAEMVTAAHITAGTIGSAASGNYWNLDTGKVVMGGTTQMGDSGKTLKEFMDATVISVDVQYAQSTSNVEPPKSGWETTCPEWKEGYYIWQKTVTTTSAGPVDSDAVCISGRDGMSFNNATLMLYKRSASEPVVPQDTVTYSFIDGKITGELSGWSTSIPTGTEQCWVTSAAAASATTTAEIEKDKWATPAMVFNPGTNGMNSAVVMLYQRSEGEPERPSGKLTYTFSDGKIVGDGLGKWKQTIPDGTDPCWVTAFTAVSSEATDTIEGYEFSKPVKLVENGSIGRDGTNVATVYLYQRSASKPKKPQCSYKYSFVSFVLEATDVSDENPSNGWVTAIPSGTNPCWIIAATASSSDEESDAIPGNEFSEPVKLVENGMNQAVVRLYQRKASKPTKKQAGTLTYRFANGEITGTLDNDWSLTIPDGTDPCWVITAVAMSVSATFKIKDNAWADPVKFVENGLNVATVYLYQRSDVEDPNQLPKPNIAYQYSFSGKKLETYGTGSTNDWETVMPSGTNPCWVISATASNTSDTDVIPKNEWSDPVKLAGNGLSKATIRLYQRSTMTNGPDVPNVDTTYTFATGVLSGLPNDTKWSQSMPSGTDPCWVTTATAISDKETDVIKRTEWSGVVKMVSNGLNTATVTLYQRKASKPTTKPSSTLTYRFSDGKLTSEPDNNWSSTIPDGTDTCWITTATALSYGDTDDIAKTEWSPVIKLVENGLNQATVYLYQAFDSNPSNSEAHPKASLTYTFSTHALSATNDSYFNGWSQKVPTGSKSIWVICATAVSTSATDTIPITEWSAPVLMSGKDGVGIRKVTEQYCRLLDGTSPSDTTEWSSDQLAGAEGYSIWTRSLIEWDDGNVTKSEAVKAEGLNGAYLAIRQLDRSLYGKDMFKRLTNNGTLQGIYTDDSGNYFINATYIGAGTVSSVSGLSYFNLDTGVMRMVSEGYADRYYNFAMLGGEIAYDSHGQQTTVRGFHIEHNTPQKSGKRGMISIAGSDGTYEPDEYYDTDGDLHTTGYNYRTASCITSRGSMYLCGIQGKTEAMRPIIKLGAGNIRMSLLAHDDDTLDTYLNMAADRLKFNIHDGTEYHTTTLGKNKYSVSTPNSSIYTWNYVRNGNYDDVLATTCWLKTHNIDGNYIVGKAGYLSGSLEVDGRGDFGTLMCTGSKNRVVDTEDYGERLLYCYETSSPMFGDIGSGVIDETGTCVVSIDDVLSETMRTDLRYHVFLQKCGRGDVWVSEKAPSYFVVEGTPGLEFDWEVKARQVDFEHDRLEVRQYVTPADVNANADSVISDLLSQDYNDEYISDNVYVEDMVTLSDETQSEMYLEEFEMIDWS